MFVCVFSACAIEYSHATWKIGMKTRMKPDLHLWRHLLWIFKRVFHCWLLICWIHIVLVVHVYCRWFYIYARLFVCCCVGRRNSIWQIVCCQLPGIYIYFILLIWNWRGCCICLSKTGSDSVSVKNQRIRIATLADDACREIF